MNKQKVIVYVDGFNFYYGLKSFVTSHRDTKYSYISPPPLKHSVTLSNSSDAVRKLSEYKARFNQAILPDEVTLSSGYVAKRPDNWV